MIKDLIEIAQEARTHLMSLPDKGNGVCNNYEWKGDGFPTCKNCVHDRYTHLCKRILAIGFEYK